MSPEQLSAFLYASSITPSQLSVVLRLLLSFLTCAWGAWVVAGLLKHLRLDAETGACDEISIYARLLRMALVVMTLLIIAYEP